MKKIIIALMFLLSVLYTTNTFAQETQSTDTVASVLERINSDLSILKRLKISGYVQAQAVLSDSSSFGSGATAYDKNFQLRRGRIKFAFQATPWSQYVMQFDVTEGGFKTKDMYAKFTDPYTKALTLTTGIFNRPFGYEIEYSSSLRESPERSRFTTTLFPNERDLGAMLTIQAPKTSRWNFIKADLALVSGNSIAAETDKFKDFIGRINLAKSFMGESLKLSGGASYYWGGNANGTNTNWAVGSDGANFAKYTVDLGSRAIREITGVDFQGTLSSNIGLSTLRGEYVWGREPGTASSSTGPSAAYTTDIYTRKFSGFYAYFVQNLGQSRHSIVVKYDIYDPNTKLAGSDVNTANGCSAADVKYNTLGLGYTFRIDDNTKIVVYYDKITNESTGIKNYTKDRKDNLLTLRLQFKF
jgi:phosphate-selective porin